MQAGFLLCIFANTDKCVGISIAFTTCRGWEVEQMHSSQWRDQIAQCFINLQLHLDWEQSSCSVNFIWFSIQESHQNEECDDRFECSQDWDTMLSLFYFSKTSSKVSSLTHFHDSNNENRLFCSFLVFLMVSLHFVLFKKLCVLVLADKEFFLFIVDGMILYFIRVKMALIKHWCFHCCREVLALSGPFLFLVLHGHWGAGSAQGAGRGTARAAGSDWPNGYSTPHGAVP